MSIRLIEKQGTNEKPHIILYNYEDHKQILPDIFETCYILNKYAKTDITVEDLRMNQFKDRRQIRYYDHMIVDTSEKSNYIYFYRKDQTVPFAAKFILSESYGKLYESDDYGLCDVVCDVDLLSDDVEVGKREIDFSKIVFTDHIEIYPRYLQGIYHMDKRYCDYPFMYKRVTGDNEQYESNLLALIEDYKSTKKKFEFLQETINLNNTL